MTDTEWARRRLERARRESEPEQKHLKGKAFREAAAKVRWVDPEDSWWRIEMAAIADGKRPSMWLPKAGGGPVRSITLRQPWEKPEVAAAARERAGEISKRKAEARRAA